MCKKKQAANLNRKNKHYFSVLLNIYFICINNYFRSVPTYREKQQMIGVKNDIRMEREKKKKKTN